MDMVIFVDRWATVDGDDMELHDGGWFVAASRM